MNTIYDDTRGLLRNALDLAKAGHPVLPTHTINVNGLCTCRGIDRKTGEPCRSGKHPISYHAGRAVAPNGLEDASTDPETIVGWFNATGGQLNFGWRCDRLFVPDIDTSGDKTGEDTWAKLTAEHGDPTPTLIIRTGRGGLHYVYELPEDVPSTRYADTLGAAVDCKRGSGHYIMVPGSKTVSAYTIESGDLLTHSSPDRWMTDLAVSLCKSTTKTKSAADGMIKVNGTSGPILDTSSWASVDGWLAAATKSSDDPTRGNSNSASYVGGIVRDAFLAGQGIHVAMRLALLTERQSDDPQEPSVVADQVGRFWRQEEEKREQGVKEILDSLAAGADPAEVIAALEGDPQFEKKYRDKLLNKLAETKANDTLAGRTDESDYAPAIGSLADVMAEVDAMDDPQWLIEGLWPEDAYGVVAAQKKAGKTWSGLDLAVSVAAGGKWLGEFQCKQGPVIYIIGEGGKRNTIRRIRAIARHKDIDPISLPIQLCTVPVQITKAEHLKLVRGWMAEVAPALVVIDPFYLSQGAANGTNLAEMGETLREIQVIVSNGNAALAILHHFKKGSASGTDQMTGVGLQEWGRVLATANTQSSEIVDEATKRTRVVLNWEFSGSEIAPQAFSTTREVWSEDPNSLVKPMYYEVSVGEPVGKGKASGVPTLPDGQQMLYDAVAAIGEATPVQVFDWLNKHKPKRKSASTLEAVKQALRRLRDGQPDLIGHKEPTSATGSVLYWIKGAHEDDE